MSHTSLSLNIGLNIGASDQQLQRHQIALALEDNLPDATIQKCYIRTAKSGEPTACLQVETSLPYEQLGAAINALCQELQQEAIAGKFAAPFHPVHRFLIGPKAENWGGEFLDEYWLAIVPENAPIPADDALAALRASEHSLEGWTVGTLANELRGWFERESDGCGGGLWFSRENPETGEEDGLLHLYDYDLEYGVSCLPGAVITVLRNLGVSVNRNFE